MLSCLYDNEVDIHDIAKLLMDKGIDIYHAEKLGWNAY